MMMSAVLKLLLVLSVLVGYGMSEFTGSAPTDRPTNGVRLYLGLTDVAISNFSTIAAAQFIDNDFGPNGQNDGLWCQSALNESMIGTWYSTTGAVLTETDRPLHTSDNTIGQVVLLRTGGIAGVQGLYRCVIPDEEGVNQTLYVAAYGNADFDSGQAPTVNRAVPSFQLLSPRYADPPVFSLSFNVTNRAPTVVTCTVDGINFTIASDDLLRVPTVTVDPIAVQATVLVRMRLAGQYQCAVNTNGSNTQVFTTVRNITVTESPTNLTVSRVSSCTALFNWTAPVNTVPSYEVFVTDSDAGTTTSTVLSGTGLRQYNLTADGNYTVQLVAFGEDLPSYIVNATIPQAISVMIVGPDTVPLPYNSNFTLTCTATLTAEMDADIELNWADPDFNQINTTVGDVALDSEGATNTSMGDSVYSLRLNFEQLQASQVGQYLCASFLMDPDCDLMIVNRTFTISVQVPQPVIDVQVIPNEYGRIFESSIATLRCFVTITALDIETVVTISWFGPNGVIVSDNSRYIISSGNLNDTLYVSELNITNIALSDNDTEYYCTANVRADDSFSQSSLVIPSATAISTNTSFIVEAVPDPVVTIEPDGFPTANDPFTLVCTGAVPSDVIGIATVNVSWQFNGATILDNDTLTDVTLSNNGTESASLIFSAVNQSTHGGDYSCSATLSIPNVPVQTTVSDEYRLDLLGDPIVSITLTGSNIAGRMYTLQCSVIVVTGTPIITWFDRDGNEVTEGNGITLSLRTVSSTEQVYDLIFNPLNYSHVGVYNCSSSLTVGDFNGQGSANTTVYVQIPPPSVSFAPDNVSPFVRGTRRSLICTVTLTPPTPPSANLSILLSLNGQPVNVNSNPRLTLSYGDTSTAVLTFAPLDSIDATNYECSVVISTEGSGFDPSIEPFIIGNNGSAEYTVTVQDIPVPNITNNIITSGIVGESAIGVCSVDVFDDLYNTAVNISIVVPDGDTVATNYSSGDTSVTIVVDSISTSDSGVYRCIVNISQSDINYQFNDVQTRTLNLTIPSPSVSVSTDPVDHSQLIGGEFLDIFCTANISQYIDTTVNVTMTWSRNGTVLTNGNDFTISPVTNVSNMYTSTLRVEELRHQTDNGATYNCSVSVQPSPVSPFITGNDNTSSGIRLTVAEFDHATVEVLIPSVPTAGDQFTLTCRITVPERLVHDVSTVRWTYALADTNTVEQQNNNATVGEIVRDGNMFFYNLTLNPVVTNDSRQYFCIAFISTLSHTDFASSSLRVRIPPPTVSITGSPSTGPIYESTNYNLTCTATVPASVVNTPVSASVVWTDPKGNEILTNDPRRLIMPPVGNSLESTLVFLPIDNGDRISANNDTGVYNCRMTINSQVNSQENNIEILSGTNTTSSANIVVEKLPPMQVNFSSVGSTEVGQSLNITCTVTVVERLVIQPTIELIRTNATGADLMSDLMIPYINSTDDTGSVTRITLILDPVRFEDGGMYTCMAEFNVTGLNGANDPNTATHDAQDADDVFNLTVSFPPISVSISQERQGILYAGTSFFFRCDITLSALVTIPVTVTNQWTRDYINVPMGQSDDTITANLNMMDPLTYNATLTFYPLDNADDSGIYTCNIDVTAPSEYTFLTNTSANASASITVEATPRPVVDIITVGTAEPGQYYMLNCTVVFINRLIVRPAVTWRKNGVDTSLVSAELNTISVPSVLTNVSDTMTSLTLTFSSLNTSDAGQYTCEAIITVDQISMTTSNTDSEDIPLQIPSPSLSVDLSKDDDFLAGSNLTVTCDIKVDSSVDTPFNVSVLWTMTDPVGSGDTSYDNDTDVLTTTDSGRVTVTDAMALPGFNQYLSQVQFSTLSSSMDSGTYACNVSIIPVAGYTYLMRSDTDEVTTNFTVTDPMIEDFAATPDSFLGLETSCAASDPYDNFTLICTASKPAIVIPDLTVVWYHNGSIRNGVVSTENGGTYVTNTLSFPNSTATDSGTYRCQARLDIPDSPSITLMEESIVTVRPQRAPYSATGVTATVGETTANIRFTIPAIAYTPEYYSINFTGLELQNTLNSSTPLSSSSNISTVDNVFQIPLTGLEEANTYNYTVVSTNCIGSTSTDIMNFTTLPALPVVPPINCMNTTFYPRNATLSWTEPVRVDQNGERVGYNLTCSSSQGHAVTGLTPTQSSTATIYTITDVVPFTSYTCDLSFINVVGTGPATQCLFNTAQDRPDDAPQDFTSTTTMTYVTFSWRRPATPNGIITRYNLTVVNVDTSVTNNSLIDVTADQETVTEVVTGFEPFQNYTATVTASTVIGYGPVVATAGRTNAGLSSAPLLVTQPVIINDRTVAITVPVVNDTTINITWSTPMVTNGDIRRYEIYLMPELRSNPNPINVTNMPARSTHTRLISGLSSGVPYFVDILAVNDFGRGENASAVVFTVVETPDIAPTITATDRSDDGTEMFISWTPISLEQARGFFQYQITLTVGGTTDRQRQGDVLTFFVPFNVSSFNATGLDPQQIYGVTVGAIVQRPDGSTITGPTMAPIDVTSRAATDAPGANTAVIGIAVGVVVALILVVIVIGLILFVVWYNRRRGGLIVSGGGGGKRKKKDLFELVETPSTLPSASTTGILRHLEEPPDIINGGAMDGPNSTSPVRLKEEQEDDFVKEKPADDRLDEEMVLERMKPIAIASFHEHVQEMHVDSDRGFEVEYKSVPMQTESPFDIGKSEANKSKNRFANIYPYDYSRVKLTEIPDSPGTDYINACTCDGYNRKDCYLAAQGPLPSTVSDFWRMIWEYRINHVVMLTGVIEGGKKKCEQYWPEKIGEPMDVQNGLLVSMTSFVPFADYIIRDLKVSKPDSEMKELVVSHYHFTSWPDHGVPQFATSLISFIKRVQKDHNKDKGVPLLVHCSAGVGRTGTFIMLDSMMDRLKVEESINVYEFLRQMRAKRMYMVQTLAQYVFIHDAMDELTTCGDTAILASNLRARVNKTHKMVPGKNVTGFQEQFELLDQVGYKPSDNAYSDALLSVNASKNRYPTIVPLNMHRPRLRPDGSSGSDYINASFVDGYKQRNAYIVTQGPLKNTVEEFWRMMMEFKTRCIVQLCNTIEEGQEKCYQYWPTKEGEPVENGRVKVTLQSETVNGDYTMRKLHICNEKGGKAEKEGHVVTQFHYTGWPEHGHPTSTGAIIELVDMLTRAQMNSGNKAITVVCNDGVGRSGAFLCIHSQLERLKTEGEVDIFKYLKTARTRRIGLLSELDHYVFCHEVLADFVESFDPYANFKDM